MPMIYELLSRRTDLSSFLIHLTRNTSDTKQHRGHSAKTNLKRILKTRVIEARNPFGPARSKGSKEDRDFQKCVSFSETPLEHINCLTCEIPGRKVRLSSFGLAFTKLKAREKGANPVWYTDITPSGKDWLMNPINEMIDAGLKRGNFLGSRIAQLCPFIEQMGTVTTQKEFWWEREWRHREDYKFFYSEIMFGLAPENLVDEFEDYARTLKSKGRRIRFLDPNWSMERIISHLTGWTDVLTPFDGKMY